MSLSPRITGAVATAAAASTTRAARRRGGRGVAWTCWRESRQSSRRRCLYPVSSSARNDPTAVETHRPAQRCAEKTHSAEACGGPGAVGLDVEPAVGVRLGYWPRGVITRNERSCTRWSNINFTKPNTIFDCSVLGSIPALKVRAIRIRRAAQTPPHLPPAVMPTTRGATRSLHALGTSLSRNTI